MTIHAKDLYDENPDIHQWHVRIHSKLPGHMVGRNFVDLSAALECVAENPGARLLSWVQGETWVRLMIEGSYHIPNG